MHRRHLECGTIFNGAKYKHSRVSRHLRSQWLHGFFGKSLSWSVRNVEDTTFITAGSFFSPFLKPFCLFCYVVYALGASCVKKQKGGLGSWAADILKGKLKNQDHSVNKNDKKTFLNHRTAFFFIAFPEKGYNVIKQEDIPPWKSSLWLFITRR